MITRRPVTFLCLLPLIAGGLALAEPPEEHGAPATLEMPTQTGPEIRQRAKQLLESRRLVEATVWQNEQHAQRYEQTFVALWDKLRAARDPLAVFEGFEFATILLGKPGAPEPGPLGIQTAVLDAEPKSLDHGQWRAWVAELREAGLFRVVQTEWHHGSYRIDKNGTSHSTFNIVINATNADRTAWYDITGPIEIVWTNRLDSKGNFIPRQIDTTDLKVQWRTGPAFFENTSLARVRYPANSGAIIARDLNGDGLSEIICPPDNALFLNKGAGAFEREPLCEHPVGVVLECLMADFTGDGRVDLLVAGSNPAPGKAPTRFPLFLYERHPTTSRFSDVPRLVIDSSTISLRYPTGITAGDIDRDGDLDLFVPQYLQPYVGGQFPTPYYDANDGLPAYLLLNSGDGTFNDGTAAGGLEENRYRRTFRSSLIDLDEDGDLDLIVVSDFAGIDVYANDGAGRFTDVTSSTVDVATNFGMAHTFGDFDTDGFVDLYVTGMGSTTARRLQAMGLGRVDLPDYQQKRMEIAYGNRMYLRHAPGRYEQPAFQDSVARSGWSWGVVTLDFDSDAHPDLYVCNGNKSGRSVKDYCTTFWCHDIYSGSSKLDAAQLFVYVQEARPYLRGNMSWNGFEHNHLLMNRRGKDFGNVAFLMNVALETDCRGVLVDDFDLDGRPDLVVDARAARGDKERDLRLLMNRGPQINNWIGVRLAGAAGISTLGARITVSFNGHKQSAVIVAGDSYGAQHAPLKHFGLGRAERVDSVDVRWPDGSASRLNSPAINQYHDLRPH